MKKLTTAPLLVFGVAAASALLGLCLPAEATIADFDLSFDGPGTSFLYDWQYNGINKTLLMQQDTGDLGSKTGMDIIMFGDSKLTVDKTIRNQSESDSNWSGYKFTIEGDNVALVPDSWDSNLFEDVELVGNTIIFSGPDNFEPGDVAIFRFDITVTNPEPSTLVLFGLGALMLKRPRRNNS